MRPVPARISWLLVLAGFLPLVAGNMQFVNPPPFRAIKDLSQIPAYRIGTSVDIIWTEGTPGKLTSVTLWQLDPKTLSYIGNIEYITRNSAGLTTFKWLVGTSQNLSVSSTFYFSIFEEGKTTGDGNSLPFNITNPDGSIPGRGGAGAGTSSLTGTTTAASSSASTASATSSTGTQQGTTATRSSASSTSSPASPVADSAQRSSVPSSGGLSTGALIGIGVSIPCAIIMGVAAGWFLFARPRRQAKTTENEPILPQGTSYPPNSHPYVPGSLGSGGWAQPFPFAASPADPSELPMDNHSATNTSATIMSMSAQSPVMLPSQPERYELYTPHNRP